MKFEFIEIYINEKMNIKYFYKFELYFLRDFFYNFLLYIKFKKSLKKFISYDLNSKRWFEIEVDIIELRIYF